MRNAKIQHDIRLQRTLSGRVIGCEFPQTIRGEQKIPAIARFFSRFAAHGRQNLDVLEAKPGIEPAHTALQAVCHL
ncbi:hypothetical protein ASD58_14480 [Duganella sp. Root1480D1]|nr:hypothetical protein ASD58_14480 [Duganella sp. Root1480D1]